MLKLEMQFKMSPRFPVKLEMNNPKTVQISN